MTPAAAARHRKVSKFLSLVLRHEPQRIHRGGRLVGQRHGRPVVPGVAAGRMWSAGHSVLLAESGVWLTDAVLAASVVFPEP